MRTRDKSRKDYGLSAGHWDFLRDYCRSFGGEGKKLLQAACFRSNPELQRELYQSLSEGLGYDRLSAREYIPIGRKDFYGYRRKALWILGLLLEQEGKTPGYSPERPVSGQERTA